MSLARHKRFLGIDLGGANIKAALMNGDKKVIKTIHLYTPFWKNLDVVNSSLKKIRDDFGETEYQFITMTGELSDVFKNRKEGVLKLTKILTGVFATPKLRILLHNMQFISPRKLKGNFSSIASANWLATSTFVSKKMKNGIFLDFGSTTTDVIPIKNSKVIAIGKNDHERLFHNELLYTGFTRTPLMSLSQKIVFRKRKIPLMAESFANTGDIYRILNLLPKELDIQETADGKEKTFTASCRRLARMVGLDKENADVSEWKKLAENFYKIQERLIYKSCMKIVKSFDPETEINIVTAGSGSKVLEKIIKNLILALGNKKTKHFPIRNFIFLKKNIRDYEVASCASAIAVVDLGLDLFKSRNIL